MQLLHTQPTVGSSPTITTKSFRPISSGVERRLDKAWVTSSNLVLATSSVGDSPSWLRHRILIPTRIGSNPISPAKHSRQTVMFVV